MDALNSLIDLAAGKSVIVYTSYRTGSTALCDYLGKKLDARNFDEAYHPSWHHRRAEFQEHLATKPDEKFIAKIMGCHINGQNKSQIDELWQRCFVIRLQRKDLAEQVVSMAISGHTRRWHVSSGEEVGNYYADISKDMLRNHARDISGHRELVAKTDRRIDLDLWYEDLDLRESNYIPRRRPDNYQELLRAAKRLIEGKL